MTAYAIIFIAATACLYWISTLFYTYFGCFLARFGDISRSVFKMR